MSNETTQLVASCLNNVPGAATALVQRFRGSVFGICFRMLRQHEDAEDATQETFIRVIRNLHRWDPTRSFEPWLYTIAGNRCKSKLQKRSRQKEVQLPSGIDVHDGRGEQTGIAEEIRLAVDNLGELHQKAFRLFHEAQCSYIEIAEQLNVPVGTIKTWVHRARKQVVEQLKRRKTIEVGS